METQIKAGENMLEQLTPTNAQTTQSAEAEENLGVADSKQFGKFKDVNALLDAYNSLQAEFTRRCQKVKELEREIKSQDKEQITNNSPLSDFEREKEYFLTAFPDAQQKIHALLDCTAKSSDDSKGRLGRAYVKMLEDDYKKREEYYKSPDYLIKAISEIPNLKEGVIMEYLKQVEASKPTVKLYSGDGGIAITPSSKPKNIADAGEIARQIFDKI